MKTSWKVILPLHSQIFRYTLFQIIFDILHFLKQTQHQRFIHSKKTVLKLIKLRIKRANKVAQ